MHYERTTEARFIRRINRFTAAADINGAAVIVHVKNTGRCSTVLLPGSRVILQRAANTERKTAYDLIAVYSDDLGWVNVDSQACNAVVKEWLESGQSCFGTPDLIRPEYVHGHSRVDFYLENAGRRILLEVKGCTLAVNGVGYFPDAPTDRGVRHLEELAAAAAGGYECAIAFVIAMPGISRVLPNTQIQPEFAAALEAAVRAGVRVLYLTCDIGPDNFAVSGWSEYR